MVLAALPATAAAVCRGLRSPPRQPPHRARTTQSRELQASPRCWAGRWAQLCTGSTPQQLSRGLWKRGAPRDTQLTGQSHQPSSPTAHLVPTATSPTRAKGAQRSRGQSQASQTTPTLH